MITELNAESDQFHDRLVTVTAEVIEWEIKEYTVTITIDGTTSMVNTISRNYLIIQDLDTTDTFLVKTQNKISAAELPADFFQAGDIIEVTGIVKSFEGLAIVDEIEADNALFATSLTSASGETIELFNQEMAQQYRSTRTSQISDATISATVIEWRDVTINVTITGENFFKSHEVTRSLLLVEDVNTQMTIVVKTNFPHSETSLPSDFFSVGDTITITGKIKTLDPNIVAETPAQNLLGDVDQAMAAFSVTNASGETLNLIDFDGKDISDGFRHRPNRRNRQRK